jgi:hypothetical protein
VALVTCLSDEQVHNKRYGDKTRSGSANRADEIAAAGEALTRVGYAPPTPPEIRRRIREIAEADAIGDPSWRRDTLTESERIALETYRDARAAMALIREAVEDCVFIDATFR